MSLVVIAICVAFLDRRLASEGRRRSSRVGSGAVPNAVAAAIVRLALVVLAGFARTPLAATTPIPSVGGGRRVSSVLLGGLRDGARTRASLPVGDVRSTCRWRSCGSPRSPPRHGRWPLVCAGRPRLRARLHLPPRARHRPALRRARWILSRRLLHLLTPWQLFLTLLGTTLGIVVGAIPGLNGSMLIALTLPVTYRMVPGDAMNLLVSMYTGSITGGLISAILLRIPGDAVERDDDVRRLPDGPARRGRQGACARHRRVDLRRAVRVGGAGHDHAAARGHRGAVLAVRLLFAGDHGPRADFVRKPGLDDQGAARRARSARLSPFPASTPTRARRATPSAGGSSPAASTSCRYSWASSPSAPCCNELLSEAQGRRRFSA